MEHIYMLQHCAIPPEAAALHSMGMQAMFLGPRPAWAGIGHQWLQAVATLGFSTHSRDLFCYRSGRCYIYSWHANVDRCAHCFCKLTVLQWSDKSDILHYKMQFHHRALETIVSSLVKCFICMSICEVYRTPEILTIILWTSSNWLGSL